jgi:hypothetical protein
VGGQAKLRVIYEGGGITFKTPAQYVPWSGSSPSIGRSVRLTSDDCVRRPDVRVSVHSAILHLDSEIPNRICHVSTPQLWGHRSPLWNFLNSGGCQVLRPPMRGGWHRTHRGHRGDFYNEVAKFVRGEEARG